MTVRGALPVQRLRSGGKGLATPRFRSRTSLYRIVQLYIELFSPIDILARFRSETTALNLLYDPTTYSSLLNCLGVLWR